MIKRHSLLDQSCLLSSSLNILICTERNLTILVHLQVFFETFNVPALFISMQAVLSL